MDCSGNLCRGIQLVISDDRMALDKGRLIYESQLLCSQ